jgi:hypothetical protein
VAHKVQHLAAIDDKGKWKIILKENQTLTALEKRLATTMI